MIKRFEKFNLVVTTWYRGYTTNTKDGELIWLSESKEHATSYSKINSAIYGGDPYIAEYNLDITNLNLLVLTDYDMDDTMSEEELYEFLNDLGVDFDVESLFDFTEDEIPLSRLVNAVLNELVDGYDGIHILEDGNNTIYIHKKYLNV